MIVYAVIGYEHYYPNPDNVLRMFLSKEKAEVFLNEVCDGPHDVYKIIEYRVV